MDVLKAAFAEGRLTQDEYNQRMDRAYRSRTYGDLAALTRDLPAGPLPVPGHPSWQPAPAAKTNSAAIVSMVLGIVAIPVPLAAIAAIISGHVAKREIRRTGESGNGLAVTGMVLGYSVVAIWAIVIFSVVMALLLHAPTQ